MLDPSLEFFTSPLVILGLLIVVSLLIHAAVYVYEQNELMWKASDYAWISVAALGLIGVAANSQSIFARYHAETISLRAKAQVQLLHSWVNIYTNSPATCMKFTRSQFSPPEEEVQRVQKLYDASCAAMKKLAGEFKVENIIPRKKNRN